MKKNEKIYVAGHRGLLGQAIVSMLRKREYKNIITRTHKELDLTKQIKVEQFFKKERPQYVILCAAKVGGIKANMSYPAEFIYENLAIQINVIHSAYLYGVKKLLFFGSACSYPRESPQPMKEEYLFSGYLEPTNEPYAMAKIAGIKMCEAYNRQYNTNFICAIPTNAYGSGDNFGSDDSHVIPALISKFYEAKKKSAPAVIIWGTGKPTREFIYIDDLADASYFLMLHYNKPEIINISTDEEVSISEVASIIKKIVGYNGKIIFDSSKPDGALRKALDTSKLNNLGWHAKIKLAEGIAKTYKWYLKNLKISEQ